MQSPFLAAFILGAARFSCFLRPWARCRKGRRHCAWAQMAVCASATQNFCSNGREVNMLLWVVRHAVAEDRETFSGPDGERPLTRKGIKQFRAFTEWLEGQATPPQKILTSPLKRAAETAEILRKSLGLRKDDVALSDALAPGAEARHLLEAARQATADPVALVGHEPDLSHALSQFVGGGEFAFGKGFVAAIEFAGEPAPGGGRLRWFVGPRL